MVGTLISPFEHCVSKIEGVFRIIHDISGCVSSAFLDTPRYTFTASATRRGPTMRHAS